jgi:hypothetical protein
MGQVAGTCECGNAHSGSIKCGEFLDWLRTGQLLRKDSAVWSKLPVEVFSLFNISFLDAFVTELRIGTISRKCLAVRPSARNRATPAGRIFVKFRIWFFY